MLSYLIEVHLYARWQNTARSKKAHSFADVRRPITHSEFLLVFSRYYLSHHSKSTFG